MEQNQDSLSLFGLSIDQTSKNHLLEAARWAKFLAIVGFIMCGLIVLIGIFAGSLFASLPTRSYNRFDDEVATSVRAGYTVAMAIAYIIFALLYFFPCLFLFHFAAKMKTALLTDSQETMNISFQNLKKMFRFVGIMTIIVLSLYVILLFFGLAAALASR